MMSHHWIEQKMDGKKCTLDILRLDIGLCRSKICFLEVDGMVRPNGLMI